MLIAQVFKGIHKMGLFFTGWIAVAVKGLIGIIGLDDEFNSAIVFRIVF